MPQPLSIWTVYKHPSDYLNKYVVRRFELDKATNDEFASDSLAEVRLWMRTMARFKFGVDCLTRMERSPDDDPVILESWI